MTHPHQLHATRAAHALADSRRQLDTAVRSEHAARLNDARITAAASAIQAWRPVIGPGSIGGHGDPASRAAVSTLEPEVRDGRLARLATSTTGTLTWLAGRLGIPATPDPLQALTDALSGLPPAASRELTHWLDEADRRIRNALHLDPPGQPLPGVRCPRCARRQLHAHTLGPHPTWTVTCTSDCLCIGADCPCTMDTTAAGVPHIWADGHPLTASLTGPA